MSANTGLGGENPGMGVRIISGLHPRRTMTNSDLDLIHDDEQYTIGIIPIRVGDATHYNLGARRTIVPKGNSVGGIWEQWDEVAEKLADVLHVGSAGIAKLKHHLDQGEQVSVTHASGGIHESFGGARVKKFLSHS
jgi:hypothetical protein